MNTLSTNQKLLSLLAAFEQERACVIPSVMPLADLYDDYCNWSQYHHLPEQSIEAFLLHLIDKKGCIPCRLPDGKVGVCGVSPKAKMATGVLQ